MNKDEILRLLEYSALSYSNELPCNSNAQLICINNKEADVEFLVEKTDNKLQIAFRGTDSLRDIMTDIKFWKKKIPYNNNSSKIRVHSGFIDAYKSEGVREAIWNFIDNSIEKVVLVGHSYGGALAVLCSVDLQYNFSDKDYEVILFGCPRVGNRAFAKSYNNRIFKTLSIDNSNDAVTKLPFEIMGYKHVGVNLHLGRPRLFFWYSVKCHRLQNYYKNLWKII